MSPNEMTTMSEQLTNNNTWKSEYDIFTPLTPTDIGIIHDANGCHTDQKKKLIL